jgi:hypothetical protein
MIGAKVRKELNGNNIGSHGLAEADEGVAKAIERR